MNTTAEMLYQKLKTLPPTQLLEVDNFLEFIKQRHDQARQTANQRLGEAMEKLSALDTPPLSAQESSRRSALRVPKSTWKPMRVVADTNTVISGLLWQGAPRQIIEACRHQRITIVSSEHLIAELADVLARAKFAARIKAAGLTPARLEANDA